MNNKLNPTEFQECLTLVDYVSLLRNQGKVLVYTHPPQETYTDSIKQKSNNKRLGVTKGLPDYIIVTKSTVLFIEMKRLKGGKVSDEQLKWIEALQGKKTAAGVCCGFDEAKRMIDGVLKREAGVNRFNLIKVANVY